MNSLMAIASDHGEVGPGAIERPLDVDPQSGLFGILTCPQSNLKNTGFIFLNSGLLHRVGPFRLYVDIARRIATSGFPSIRLDLSGKGDSDALPGVSLADANVVDISAACRKLNEETGVRKFVIGGLCSGADDALQAGLEIDGLAGLFMFDGYAPKTIRYYIKRYGPKVLSVQSWFKRLHSTTSGRNDPEAEIGSLRNWGTRRDMLERYDRLVNRGTHILAIFSGWAGNDYVYPSQLITTIGNPQAVSLVSELHYPDAAHLFPLSMHRRLAVSGFNDWAECSFPDAATVEEMNSSQT